VDPRWHSSGCNDISEQRARQLSTLNVVTAGAESYTRPDGVNVIALGHLFAK